MSSDLERVLIRRSEIRWRGAIAITGLGVGMGTVYFVVTLVLELARMDSSLSTILLALVTAVSVAVAGGTTAAWVRANRRARGGPA